MTDLSRFDQVAVSPTPLDELSRTDRLRVLPIPDLHLPNETDYADQLLEHRTFLDQQDLVVLLGDMTNRCGSVDEYRVVKEFLIELNRPYCATNGNHEIAFVPYPMDDDRYGTYESASPDVTEKQLERFEDFFGLDDRFCAHDHPLAGLCVLGLDALDERSRGKLTERHERWFRKTLSDLAGRPLVVFAHMPLETSELDEIAYYGESKPYYAPSEPVRTALAERDAPTFWFSGHLHMTPEHPRSAPYRTDDGVWQIHCPDITGHGRERIDHESPTSYDALYLRSIELDRDRLSVVTSRLSDVRPDQDTPKEIDRHTFPLTSERS